jgi:hypothetical protein
MARSNVKINKRGMNELAKHVVATEGVARMTRVADACNAELGSEGYKVSVEGDNPLSKRDYRATVITANADSIRYDRKHDALLRNFGIAEG